MQKWGRETIFILKPLTSRAPVFDFLGDPVAGEPRFPQAAAELEETVRR